MFKPDCATCTNTTYTYTCTSQQTYGDNKDYEENCCQDPGVYTLNCKSSNGNGWHGGYIEINGEKYCDDFTSGDLKTVRLKFEQNFTAPCRSYHFSFLIYFSSIKKYFRLFINGIPFFVCNESLISFYHFHLSMRPQCTANDRL